MYSLHCSFCTNMLFVHILFNINILLYFLGFDSLLKCLWTPYKIHCNLKKKYYVLFQTTATERTLFIQYNPFCFKNHKTQFIIVTS